MNCLKNILIITATAAATMLAAQENQAASQLAALKAAADQGSARSAYEYATAVLKTKSPDIPPDRKALNESETYMAKAIRLKYPKALLASAENDLSGKIVEHNFNIYAKALLLLNELANTPLSQDFTSADLNKVYSLTGRASEFGAGTAKSAATAFRYYALGAEIEFDAANGARQTLQFSGINDKNRLEFCFFITWKMNLLNPTGQFTKERIVTDVFENTRQNEWADARKNYLKYYCDYIEKTAAAGDMDAIEYLAQAYSEKDGLFPLKKTAAAEYFIKSAARGNRESTLTLAELYGKSFGAIPKDETKVIEYSKLALLSTNRETTQKAAKILENHYSEKKDLKNEFRYAVLSGNLIRANEIIAADKNLEFSNMGFYLKAKEFQAENTLDTPRKISSYIDRLRMAANAGNDDAIIELAKYEPRFDKEKLLGAIQRLNLPKDAAILAETAKLYAETAAEKDGAEKEKFAALALKNYIEAAKSGNTAAAAFMVKAYNSGNELLGIKRDVKQLVEYIRLTAELDYAVQYPEILKTYIAIVSKGEGPSQAELSVIQRAAFRNAKAAAFMAELYLTGSEKYGIEQDNVAALFLMSLAASEPQAAAKLVDFYSSGRLEGIQKDANLAKSLSVQIKK